ncbi:MAG: ferredoxin reductase [Acidimicrobiia bacterium]
MEGTPAPSGGWHVARVVEVIDETSRAKTFRLLLTDPVRHLPGQHYVVRLTAPDGYTASRSYSVASAPDDSGVIDLTVERLTDGEVSTFLHDVVVPGDELEVRGPIGGWFVWPGDTPALLVGGGSGMVPLMAMLRHARATGVSDLLHLVVSVRSPSMLFYRDEIAGPEVTIVFTREPPADDLRKPGRLQVDDVASYVRPGVTAYVCGAPPFCDAVTDLLLGAGIDAARVRVERFGPSG